VGQLQPGLELPVGQEIDVYPGYVLGAEIGRPRHPPARQRGPQDAQVGQGYRAALQHALSHQLR